MIDLTVKTLDSQNHAFSLDDDQITVRGFKEYIAESVAVPADSQRLIYCGRVLQDEKKLNDYDVNGKVIHLVQRAPPQAGQRNNDGSQAHAHNYGQNWQNPQRSHYRVTRTQMHSNAMYVGAMSVPAEIVEGHGLPLPQLSSSLSNSRLIIARRMLDRVNEIMDRLDDPSRPPPNPPASESQPILSTQVLSSQELEAEQEDNNAEGRANSDPRLTEATAAAIAAALSAVGANNVTVLGGTSDEGHDTRGEGETRDDSQTDAQPRAGQQQQSQQQQQQSQTDREGSTSNADGQNNRRTTPQLPRPPQMAELLERLNSTQDRLRPYIERYRQLMLADPLPTFASGPEGVEETQRIVDGVSETLHYMSHACHALSDIIVDMWQQPPRNLRCRPILIQHSAILQPGIPIQVEAHISLHGRNANNNNVNEETNDSTNVIASNSAELSELPEENPEDANQRQDSENIAQPQAEQQPQREQEQTQSPFGTVFNLQNNVEVLMEVSPESNMEATPGTGPSQNTENNNNNNNTGRISGTATFPWGSAPPPDFIRNLMQAVAGHMVQSGITTTTITTRNPPTTVGGQSATTSHDSGTSNAGQSTQARSNVGTHPTTATQTRSTSRPHVFHQQPHPLGVGMSLSQGLDFDPCLPCNSHHVRRTPSATPNNVNATPQAARPNQTSTSETQTEAQTANAPNVNNNTSSPDPATSATSQATNNNSFMTLLQQMLGGDTSGQPQANISINSNASELAESLRNIMQMLGGGNIHVGIVEDGSHSSIGSGFTLADLLENGGLSLNTLGSHETGRDENFLVDLFIMMAQNMTLEGLLRLRCGQSEPIAHLRRPLQEFFQHWISTASSPEAVQEEATERFLSQIRPRLQNVLATEEDGAGRSGPRIDICATVEAILRRHIREIVRLLFDNGIDDTRFGQEIQSIVNTLSRQLCGVLRYSIRNGQAGLEAVATRFMTSTLTEVHPALHQWLLNSFIVQFHTYSLRIPQPPNSEIFPLLVYKDVPSQTASSTPLTATNQTPQPQTEHEPMETETVEERPNNDLLINDGEEIPERSPGRPLPVDWVPIIGRDAVRQNRQLQMQEMTNGGVTPFSDAYLGGLPTKRRKLIEEQKSRLLVNPTPNHSVITASMESLVREGMGRAGVQEVEGAAVAVAADPGVRRTFGRAIRDCLNPHRYETPDFPDPLRFPNATKYFTEKETPPK